MSPSDTGGPPRSEGGQAAVELALALPLVAVALLASVQVVLVAIAQVVVVHAAREGARAAAVAAWPAPDGEAAARQAAGGLAADRLTVRVRASGDRVWVTVRYQAPTDVPLVGALVGDVALEATATMLREP